MIRLQKGMPATWNHKYPYKTGCHTHFQQSGLLLGTIPAILFLELSLERLAPPRFLFACEFQSGRVAALLAGQIQKTEGRR